jgi:predicted nucleotide-binding protein
MVALAGASKPPVWKGVARVSADSAGGASAERKKPQRNFPLHELKEAVRVAQTIRDENAGNPMNTLLVADALGLAPGSSNYRDLLSSSYKYGLTEGTQKALDISLTALGRDATSSDDGTRQVALRKAAQAPNVFARFLEEFDQNKLPSTEMLPKILSTKFDVPESYSSSCADMLVANARWVGLLRDLTGGPRVMLDAAPLPSMSGDGDEPTASEGVDEAGMSDQLESAPASPGDTTPNGHAAPAPPTEGLGAEPQSRILFVGHGKKRGPLEKVEKFLIKYGIPHLIAVDEPNAGRPLPTKVAEIMKECGAAILIFTKDEQFMDMEGNEVWRPSENVVYELGAASLLYDNRIVIFMEEGLKFPANFESVGHIEFAEDQIEAKTSELLAELIALKLIKITVS